MNRGIRMAGMRLGLTYAAALVLLGLLVAMVAAPAQTRSSGASRSVSERQQHATPVAAGPMRNAS